MPRTHDKFIIPLTLLIALAPAVSGCSLFGERTEANTLVTGDGGTDPWCASSDDAWLIDDGADLKGPHFALSILCHYQGAEIPEDVAARADALADLPKAANGVEFLVNQIAHSPIYKAEFEDGETAAWIQVGDERTDLDALPAPGSFLAVAAPEGEDAVLWVEDDGRAQGLDLRTGERHDPVAAYYNGVAAESASLSGFNYVDFEVTDGTDSWFLTCPTPWAGATRNAWLDGRGWAEEGQVFMTVAFNWCHTYTEVAWVLDPETAVTVDGAGPIAWEEAATGTGSVQVAAIFSVPGDAAEIPIVFTPFGHAESVETGEPWAFVEDPEPTDWLARF
ncbi:hypothetical protein [Glycomyces sambucus]|uniref:hypothetical protein n=1 Tax=Glycomyces sambucus TaxID=380244 RepID=UPI000B88CE02|nr:hypothetical protein [Glycomyces sambucus]